MTTLTGTKEWAPHSVNCITGCAHNCKYCYAREMAVRFKRKTRRNWHIEEADWGHFHKSYKKYNGRVMFPTTHDMTPENWKYIDPVLANLVAAGNDLLLVTKPHPDVIKYICRVFAHHKDHIEFRFTITARNPDILKYWEPNAPSFDERRHALEHACHEGFRTSISIEPMLDTPYIDEFIGQLDPAVTGTIWLGKMNDIRRRVRIATNQDREMVAAIEAGQTDERIREIYDRWNGHPKIRWKDSIKKVIGLPLETAEQEPANA